MFVNPIMRRVAPRIIFEWIQFSERTRSSRNHEALLAKQNGKVMAKMSLLSLSGSVLIKTMLMKHWQRHCGAPRPCFCQNKYRRWQTERCSDDRSSRSLYTSKVI